MDEEESADYNLQEDIVTPSKKKVRYSQKYLLAFELDPLYKGWIKSSVKGDGYAYCRPSDTYLKLTAGKTDLTRHSQNKKHISMSTAMCGQRTLTSLLSTTTTASKFSESVREGELRMAAFIAEHDLPISIADHLPELIGAICPDSKIAQNLICGRTKATALINNVLGEEEYQQLILHLKKNQFSLIVDESTDKGCVKHLCMVARVLNNDSSSVMDAFLGLIPLKDATANTLYGHVLNFFNKTEIPYKENMIGFAADGANAMLGEHHSLSSLLKKDIPHLFIMKCICHSFALCASYACLKLPRSIEDLARDVYSYFQCSPKRLGELEEFQQFTNVKPHKLLHPSQTRWLSLHMVVSRLLEQYNALKLYFTNDVLGDRLIAPGKILQRLDTPVTKLYLMFLGFILPVFNKLNKQMQSESTQVHALYSSVSLALKTILGCYMKDSYLKVTLLKDIKFRDQSNLKPLGGMYLGIKVEMEIQSATLLEGEEIRHFRMSCLEFLIESTSQIYKRFPFDSIALESLKALSPKVVIEREVPSLINLISSFPHLAVADMQVLDTEWRLLSNATESLEVNDSMRPEEFWNRISKSRQMDNVLLFPNLSKFMQTLLCLPHSSATVERVFSSINRMKTKSRNRLSTNTLTGLLYTKQLIKGKTSYNCNITKTLLKRAESGIYRQEK